MIWVQEILGKKLGEDGDMKDQTQFANILKDGSVLCE